MKRPTESLSSNTNKFHNIRNIYME